MDDREPPRQRGSARNVSSLLGAAVWSLGEALTAEGA